MYQKKMDNSAKVSKLLDYYETGTLEALEALLESKKASNEEIYRALEALGWRYFDTSTVNCVTNTASYAGFLSRYAKKNGGLPFQSIAFGNTRTYNTEEYRDNIWFIAGSGEKTRVYSICSNRTKGQSRSGKLKYRFTAPKSVVNPDGPAVTLTNVLETIQDMEERANKEHNNVSLNLHTAIGKKQAITWEQWCRDNCSGLKKRAGAVE